jgi:hypothetical protein
VTSRGFKVGAGLAVLTAVIAFAGVRYYHTALCNGYNLVRMNGYEVVVANPRSDIVTRGTVTMFDVKSPYVTGYTSTEHMAPDTDPVDGYFVLDTTSGNISDGLSENAWRKRLSELRWEHPAIRKPW